LIEGTAHGAAFADVVARDLAVPGDRAEYVVEVVRAAIRKPPERFQFGRLLQLTLHLFALALPHSLRFLREFALRDIHHDPGQTRDCQTPPKAPPFFGALQARGGQRHQEAGCL
jgi:hypothetical protein